MAAKEDITIDAMKEELSALRKQVGELAATIKAAGTEKSSEMTERLEKELERLQKLASEKVQKVYDTGSAGLEDVSERVRQNPLGSLLVAFGAGYILSKIFRGK